MIKRCYIGLSLLLPLLLSGCIDTTGAVAPVVAGWQQSDAVIGDYQVAVGDNIHFVAYRFGIDERDLIALNQLEPPYTLTPGEYIKTAGVIPKRTPQPEKTIQAQAPASPAPPPRVASAPPPRPVPVPTPSVKIPTTSHAWVWPTKGNVITNYSNASKGIDIAGTKGQAIVAAKPGIVVYAGSGISSYGNLLIIKHDDEYLSAYAHNKEILIKEGSEVNQGQVIAHMGDTGSDRVKLHFEIRKAGKPVDPITYLPNA